MAAIMREILDTISAANGLLHVSLDVDFLDPDIAPGVGTTVPGGATFREAHLIMEMLSDSGLVSSLDLVELNPFLDDRGKSARVLVELAASLFGRRILDRPTRGGLSSIWHDLTQSHLHFGSITPRETTMSASADLIATEHRLGAHNYKPLDVVLTRGEGVYVWDTDGNRYLDCLSAYSAVNQGHCHPKILRSDDRAGRKADADLPRLPQRPARLSLRRTGGADRLRTRSCR